MPAATAAAAAAAGAAATKAPKEKLLTRDNCYRIDRTQPFQRRPERFEHPRFTRVRRNRGQCAVVIVQNP
ncbi:hypothetical protein Emag_004799 [Eimeria magna]